MKRIILFLMFLFSVSVSGQKVVGNGNLITQTHSVAQNYKAVLVKGSFDVYLTDNPQGEIRIQADENIIPFIRYEVVGDELVLSWKEKISVSTRKGIKIFVPSQQIERIKLKGSGDVFGEAEITADEFSVNLEGSGDVQLKLNAQKLQVKLMGSGDIDLQGTAQKASFSVLGSGDVSAVNLVCQIAEVSVSGSGDVSLTAKKEFTGKILGSGDISVKGNPEKIKQQILGSGDIDFE